MSRKRRSIDWGKYLDEIVPLLRTQASAKQISAHLNERHGLELVKNNIISAMRSKDARMSMDGPLIRLLHERYPHEAAALIAAYREQATKCWNIRNENGTVPSNFTKRAPRTPEETAARRRAARPKAAIVAYPSSRRILYCSALLDPDDPASTCGEAGGPYCPKHAEWGRKQVAAALMRRRQSV